MEELFKRLKTLQNISGTNDKKLFIKNNQDDKLFLDALEFLLNPYKVTNISKKKIDKKVKIQSDKVLLDLNDFFDYLTKKCTGKDEDIAVIQKYINEHKEFENELKELATKSMKLGVQGKLVNTALGYDLIPMFSCMLGESYFKNENKVKGKFILSTKLDGSRILILKENGKVKCMSRQGQVIEGLDEIIDDVERMNFNDGVIDGELLAIGEFKDSAEQYKETMKRSRIKGNKVGLKVVAYDFITNIENFYKGRDDTPCIIRKMRLENLIRNSKCKFIEYLDPLYYGNNKEIIQEKLKEAIENNQEGVMLNLYDAPYECKRSKGLLKVKVMQTCDLRIIGFEEGDGKYKNTLGKVICDYKGYILGVGSGFSDELRYEIWNNKNKYLNRVCEIQYFEETHNEEGGLSVRFPVFKCIRELGKDVSYD